MITSCCVTKVSCSHIFKNYTMTTFSDSLQTSENENILNVLGKLIDKMSLMFSNIETRLNNIENEHMRELSAIKESLEFIKDRALSCSSLTSSDQLSLGDSDSGCEQAHGGAVPPHTKGHDPDLLIGPSDCAVGLILSDSDLTLENSNHLNSLLQCDTHTVNYNTDSERVGQLLLDAYPEFVLIQDSGETVSLKDKLSPESTQEIQNLVGQQLELARTVVRLKPDTQVFIGSLPPRVDTMAHSQMAEFYNSTAVAESFLDDHITVVSQNNMFTNVKKKLQERIREDGFNLTKYGTHLMMKNISRQIADKVQSLRFVIKNRLPLYGRYNRNHVKRFLSGNLR